MTEPSWAQREAWQKCPDDRIVMYQSWRNLAFLHWKMPPEWLAPKLPPTLNLDTHDGEAWLGVVPFEMRYVRPAGLPAVPYVSNFLELNLRTYVYDDQGRPGVWFFSLSANRALAVWAARTFFHLPYFWSRMDEVISANDNIAYQCQRFQQRHPAKIFQFEYKPTGPTKTAAQQTLEFFLTERYLMFAENPRTKKISCGQVHHAPYKTSQLLVKHCDSSIVNLDDFSSEPSLYFHANPQPDHALFCRGVDVKIFGLHP